MRAVCLLLLWVSLSFSPVKSQESKPLPRSNPAAEGVSAQAIADFLTAVNSSRHEMHSFMMLRHGKVVAEAWWDPYKPQLRHTLYSCSKSFTAIAAEFALQEGLLQLDDKVLKFFPDLAPDTISDYWAALQVRHLLTMAVGMRPDPTFNLRSADTNWIASFLRTPILDAPGSQFLYNTMATYMVGVIVQRVSGQSLLAYLKPRLFDPLGITGMDWERDLLGYEVGGWGLRLKTEDMAKFAQFLLQKGRWGSRQLLPSAWIDEASSAHILQQPDLSDEQRGQTDWAQGYGYQLWRSRHNSFRGDGAYGQFMLVLPEQDAVIAITSETDDMQGLLNLVWAHLLPGFDVKIPRRRQAEKQLRQQLAACALPELEGAATTSNLPESGSVAISLEDNKLGWRQLLLTTKQEGALLLELHSDAGVFQLGFTHGEPMPSSTVFIGPNLVSFFRGHFQSVYPARVLGQYAWTQPDELTLELRYIESPHAQTITLRFMEQREVEVQLAKSLDFGRNPTSIKGRRQ